MARFSEIMRTVIYTFEVRGMYQTTMEVRAFYVYEKLQMCVHITYRSTLQGRKMGSNAQSNLL